MLTRSSSAEEVLLALYRYFGEKSATESDWPGPTIPRPSLVKEILGRSRCKVICRDSEQPSFPASFNVYLFVPPSDIDHADFDTFKDGIISALRYLIHDEDCFLDPWVQVKALLPQEEHTIGLNNCSFKREKTYLHDELRFRSKGEIPIYDELKRRDVLFLPNPAAVSGCSASVYGQSVDKREPDFLICYKGKWGILEVNHDFTHSGLANATRDHERFRRFQHYGLFFCQAFDYGRCCEDPVGVVDEFLMLLEKHK